MFPSNSAHNPIIPKKEEGNVPRLLIPTFTKIPLELDTGCKPEDLEKNIQEKGNKGGSVFKEVCKRSLLVLGGVFLGAFHNHQTLGFLTVPISAIVTLPLILHSKDLYVASMKIIWETAHGNLALSMIHAGWSGDSTNLDFSERVTETPEESDRPRLNASFSEEMTYSLQHLAKLVTDFRMAWNREIQEEPA